MGREINADDSERGFCCKNIRRSRGKKKEKKKKMNESSSSNTQKNVKLKIQKEEINITENSTAILCQQIFLSLKKKKNNYIMNWLLRVTSETCNSDDVTISLFFAEKKKSKYIVLLRTFRLETNPGGY